MAAVDLLFKQTPNGTPPIDLLFGEVDALSDYDLTVAATLPALTLSAYIAPSFDLSVNALLPALTLTAAMTYDSAVDRPLVGRTQADWQVAIETPSGVNDAFQGVMHIPSGKQSAWQTASPSEIGIDVRQVGSLVRSRSSVRAAQQDASRISTWAVLMRHQDGLRDRRPQRTSLYQEAVRVGTRPSRGVWQEMLRDRRPLLDVKWQVAAKRDKLYGSGFSKAKLQPVVYRARHQEAIVPPAGISTIVVPPNPFDPCYLPDPNLLFKEAFGAYRNLLFICERHGDPLPPGTIEVPIRSVYVVINNVTLIRVSDSLALPALGLSLSIDADSWTWGFNASLPASSLGSVQPTVDGPVELLATINASPYRLVVEKISRERTFNSSTIRISGRGRSAFLASPYSPVLTFANDEARTAQQLMADVLTLNGVPIGWDIDWQLDDWLVSDGAFNMRGSYIDGLLAVAGAAGAYLQPHPTDTMMRVMLRYPAAPWEWGTVSPDVILPSAVTVQEGIEWIEKPEYNRVFVSGTSHGIVGRVTRTGSAGDLLAPMVTDPLITAVNAARQRGIAVLADTGKQAMVSLRLPVLPETGIITPGKWVRYTDGSDIRFGIVRSTGVEVGLPETFQSIQVETRVA